MSTDPSLQNVKCPECKGPMVSRKNHKDGSRFWGCKDYPRCKGTRDSMGMSKEDRQSLEGEGEDEEHPIRWDRKS